MISSNKDGVQVPVMHFSPVLDGTRTIKKKGCCRNQVPVPDTNTRKAKLIRNEKYLKQMKTNK
jgi:hypothetical protein